MTVRPWLVLAIGMLAPSAVRGQAVKTGEESAPQPRSETMDVGLFRLEPGHAGVAGGTLVRLTRPGTLADHLLVVWYGGPVAVNVAEMEPVMVHADGELVRLPMYGVVRRSADPGNGVNETWAYRMSPQQLRQIAGAYAVRLRVAAAESVFTFDLTGENLRKMRAFVDALLGPAAAESRDDS
jgi:hypothetical protein